MKPIFGYFKLDFILRNRIYSASSTQDYAVLQVDKMILSLLLKCRISDFNTNLHTCFATTTTHSIYLNTNHVKYAADSGASSSNLTSKFKHKMHIANNKIFYFRLYNLVD